MPLSMTILAWTCAFAVLSWQTNGQCNTNADCTNSNTVCISGSCECEQGFTILNGECEQVLGRTCMDHVDCDDDRTLCVNSQCRCQSLIWREDNGKCVSYYGIPCTTWAHCGAALGYECINKFCGCSPGYEYTNGICEKVLSRTCSLNSTLQVCPLEHTFCQIRSYVDRNKGQCYCNPGYTEKYGECIQVLGSSCNDVTCGNTLHSSYELLKSNHWQGDANYWQSYFSSYHIHLTCGADNVCTCNHGFIADDILCTPVVGRPCSSQRDCGNYPGYSCNVQTSRCDCSTDFYPFVRVWNYNTTDINSDIWSGSYPPTVITVCISVIGQSCSNVTCPLKNSYCNELDMCVCAAGFTETSSGTCQPVLGMTCFRETLCEIVDGGTCDNHNLCVCKEGYVKNGHLCQKVLGSTCVSKDDCRMSNSVCEAGKCACMSGFKERSNKCLREDCLADVRLLPDFHRRSVHKKLLKDEPVIDDSLLKEGWYSLGTHTLHASRTASDPGYCSTYYPIYMAADLTSDQMESMKYGSVSITAVVGSHDIYEQRENIAILVRNCGAETQIYIKPPKTHFSGFCIGSQNPLNISSSNELHAIVAPDLLFKRKHEDSRTKYTPYVVFSCLPTEMKAPITNSLYPHNVFQNMDDIFFYNVHWYLNDIHFKSFGPVKKRNIVTETSVFEAELLLTGFRLGDKIRCSLEISEDSNSLTALLANSEDYFTGMQEMYRILQVIDNRESRLYSPNIPLGCETFDEDERNYCEMEWPAIVENDETGCNITQSGHTDNRICGFTLKGFSYKGYVNQNQSWRKGYLSNNHIYYENDSYSVNINERFIYHVEAKNGSDGWDFKIKFAAANISTGHQLWEGYRLPYAWGHIIQQESYKFSACRIEILNVPVIYIHTYRPSGYIYNFVTLDSVGEFLLFRSRTSMVEIHIETEDCTSTVSRICICGWSYRNGEDIYVLSNCNGVRRFKQVYGDKINRDLELVVLMNGATMAKYPHIQINKERDYETIVTLFTMEGKETVDTGEGLCAHLPGSYKHRNGTVMPTSEGFASSWLLSAEESLYNAKNHKQFCAWPQKYLLCYCPSDAKKREVTYHSNYTYGNRTSVHENINVYNSYLQCSTEIFCNTEIIGEGVCNAAEENVQRNFSFIIIGVSVVGTIIIIVVAVVCIAKKMNSKKVTPS